ncbi:excisionase [Sansalvadorimonas verongulae]|nr:excisionase [Sansalvadorimonas verongulae]
MLQWVRLKKYCELSGETKGSVNHKRAAGLWLEGQEFRVADDSCVWINLEAVNRWAEGRKGRRKTK